MRIGEFGMRIHWIADLGLRNADSRKSLFGRQKRRIHLYSRAGISLGDVMAKYKKSGVSNWLLAALRS
jgi:hypothetical protein